MLGVEVVGMENIIYTDHLKLRLKIRKIPNEYPKLIYKEPDQIFYDVYEDNLIAVKKLKYNNKLRNMMIAYEKEGDNVDIITIHPITGERIKNRLLNKRWVKNEEAV